MVFVFAFLTVLAVVPASAVSQPSVSDTVKSNVLYSQADIKEAYDAGKFNELFTLEMGLMPTVTKYENDTLIMSRANSNNWSVMKMNIPTSKVDTTVDNWLEGKTMEFELVMDTTAGTTTCTSNRTFVFAPYTSTEAVDGRTNGNYSNYGCTLWYWRNSNMLKSVNGYPFTHPNTGSSITVPEGGSVKLRVTQTETHLIYSFYNEATKAYEPVVGGTHEVSSLQYADGAPYMGIRGRDYYGIKNFIIYENSDAQYYGSQETNLYGDKFDIRFIAALDKNTVDSGVYSEIGFEVSAEYGESAGVSAKRYGEANVYTSLNASDKTGNIKAITAPDGKYFVALSIEEIPTSAGNITFLVKPYVIKNGVYIYGPSYEVKYNAATAEYGGATLCTDGR